MTLNQFKTWALASGSVAKYDDGQFVGECVSLINQYCYRVLGVPAGAWGHAYAWANDNNPNRAYFDKVSSIQDGDVIVYGTNFTPLYGHIGIAFGGQILDQNGRVPRRVALGGVYYGHSAILRPKNNKGGEFMARSEQSYIDEIDRLLHGDRGIDWWIGQHDFWRQKAEAKHTFRSPVNGDERDAQGWYNAYAERDAQWHKTESRVGTLEKEVAELKAALGRKTDVDPDSIVITRAGFAGLFDVVKNLFKR